MINSVKYIIDNNITVSTAESCTGGMIAHKFTCVPGASNTYKGGVVAYTNEAKMNLLNVPKHNIDTYTEVSEQVATDMAVGCLKVFDTDMAVATTGYAQPFTGYEQHAYIGIAYKSDNGIVCNVHRVGLKYPKARHRFIEFVTEDAIELLMETVNTIKGE